MSDTDNTLPPGLRHPNLRTIENPVLHEKVTFTSYSRETNGAFTAVDIEVHPGGGPPLHYHTRQKEHFTAGSAQGCGVEVDGETRILKQGESAVAEVGHVHRFFNHMKPGSDEAANIIVKAKIEALDGKGTEEWEMSLSIAYGLARDGLVKDDGTPTNPVHVAIVSRGGDLNLPGLGFKLASPILNGLLWYAKWSGEEQRLLDKYWYGR